MGEGLERGLGVGAAEGEGESARGARGAGALEVGGTGLEGGGELLCACECGCVGEERMGERCEISRDCSARNFLRESADEPGV